MMNKTEFFDSLESFLYKSVGPNWEWDRVNYDDSTDIISLDLQLKVWRLKKEETK